jgi:hypothetical protein
MKPNYKHLSVLLLGALYIVGMLYVLYGCSANYHFTKFLNKGGKIDTISKVVTVEKTIKVNGKDSIIFVEMPLNCPEVQIPPTRTEIRYKYKLKRDSIETVRYVTKWKTKEVIKTNRIEAKAKKVNWWKFFIIGLSIGFGLGAFLVVLLSRFNLNLKK